MKYRVIAIEVFALDLLNSILAELLMVVSNIPQRVIKKENEILL